MRMKRGNRELYPWNEVFFKPIKPQSLMKKPITRRQFITQAAAGSAGAMAFPFLSRGARHGAADKLNVACVGIGHMGNYAVTEGLGENLVGLCDVDWRRDEKLWGDRSPAKIVGENPKAKQFTDFRRMLDTLQQDIDVVLVSTPDHTHFPVAMAAMEYGKLG